VLQVEEETRRARAGAGKQAACVAARAAAARRGEGRGEASGGRASGWRGRWWACGAERSGMGVAGAWEMAGEGGGVTSAGEQGEGLEVEHRDLSAIFQIMRGLYYKAKLTFKP
jgi:hypothetical protein